MPPKHFYITTPIYYVNDKPHIGHAYTSIACDVLARFMRLDGYTVKFLTGVDEHGQKVEKSAAQASIDPQAFTDTMSESFRGLSALLNLSNDDFIRTTEPRHKKSVQAIWKKLEASGDIYLGKYAGWYSVRDEAFYGESELVDGKAPTGAPVEWVEEPSYFFRLSAWGEKLLTFYDEHPDFIAPTSRRNEVVSFVKGGLTDLSISRTSFKWGIPVPGDEKHVMYVWLDALVNYLTAVGYPGENTEEYKTFWPADLHMVGKDILRFHAVYWPAFLLSAGIKPPKRVFAHGWWTIEGEKMSKSLGNVISPQELVEHYGVDATRYFLLREVPFGNDGNFSKEALITRVNAELANNIGNLAQRTLTQVQKNCEGRVPSNKMLMEEDKALMAEAQALDKKIRPPMEIQKFHEATDELVRFSASLNEYVDRQAPWKLKKENPERMEAVLYTLLEGIRCIAILLQPWIPGSAGKLLDQLAVPANDRTFASLGKALKPGTALPAPQPVFPRLEAKL